LLSSELRPNERKYSYVWPASQCASTEPLTENGFPTKEVSSSVTIVLVRWRGHVSGGSLCIMRCDLAGV
jgi:hypothetical protein